MNTKEVSDYVFHNIPSSYLVTVDPRSNPHGLDRLPPDYYLNVPCGKCSECRKSRRSGWAIRLIKEFEQWPESTFVTLTLDEQWLPIVEREPKKYLIRYIDRLRKSIGKRPRYFFISELGDKDHHTGRLHFHGLFFGTDKDTMSYALQRSKWPHGNSWTGYVQYKTCYYLTKYMLKQQGDYKPIMLLSRGIGLSYVTDDRKQWHINGFDFRDFIKHDGRVYSLPQYYKLKMFSDDVKLCRMLNRMANLPDEWFVHGVRYTDPKQADEARAFWYNHSLSNGTSLPVTLKIKQQSKIYYSILLWQVLFSQRSRLPLLLDLTAISLA